MAKKGTCENCGRENMTLQMRNMCGGCNFRVKGMDVGSAEYKAALAQAKKDFNNPDHKQTHKRKRGKQYEKYVSESHEQGVMPLSRNKYKKAFSR